MSKHHVTTPVAKARTRLMTSAAIATMASAAIMAPLAGTATAEPWQPRVSLGGGYDDYNLRGDTEGAGEFRFFVPLSQSAEDLLFLDGRAYVTNQQEIYGAGLTYRSIVDEGLILGGGVHVEFTETEFGNDFGRLILEGEALGERWDARVRAYIPDNETSYVPSLSEFDLDDMNGLIVYPGEETSPWGITGEAGYSVFLQDNIEARGYLGGYYFDADGFDSIAGPTGRLEIHIDDIMPGMPGARLSGYVQARYDDERDFESRGIISVSIPFNGSTSAPADMPERTRLQDRLGEQFTRDPFTTLTRADVSSPTPAMLNGAPLSAYFFNEGGSGTMDGSSPENAADYDGDMSLLSIADLPSDAIAVILGGTTIDTVGQTLSGIDNIVVMGGGSSVTVQAGTLFDVDFTAPGSRPTVERADAGGDNLTLTVNNAQVIGMTFQGGDNTLVVRNAGVLGAIIVKDVAVVDPLGVFANPFGGDGLIIDNSQNVTVSNFSFTDTDDDLDNSIPNNDPLSNGDAIHVNFSTNVVLSNISVDGADRSGIIFDSVSEFSVDGATFVNGGGPTPGDLGVAMFNSSNGTLNNISISGQQDGNGLIFNNTDNVMASNISIANVGTDGVRVFNGSSGITVSGITVDGTGQQGINVAGGSNDVTVTNFSISNVGFNGILISGMGTNGIAIDNGSITNIGLAYSVPNGRVGGIHIRNQAGDLAAPIVVSNVTIAQTVPDFDDGDDPAIDTSGILIFGAGNIVQIANNTITGLFEAGLRVQNAGPRFMPGSTGNTTDVIPACSADAGGPGIGSIEINGTALDAECNPI